MNEKRIKMKDIYNQDNDYVLQRDGWNSLSDSTLNSYKKADLIDIIRCLEHNWAGSLKAVELQSRRLENFYNYCKDTANQELFTKLTDDDYYSMKDKK